MSGTCSCGNRLGRNNRSGRCRSCNARHMALDPEFQQRRRDGVRARMERDPAWKASVTARLHRHAAEARKRPEFMAWLRSNGHDAVRYRMRTPQALAKLEASRKAAGRKRSETVMAWCPPAYRNQYHNLVQSKNLPAAEARRVILDQIAADEARMSPFERQMRAVANGARLVEKPVLRKPDYAFTLGGVTGEFA